MASICLFRPCELQLWQKFAFSEARRFDFIAEVPLYFWQPCVPSSKITNKRLLDGSTVVQW